ncbi:MAG: VOC family protein [Chloroflexota bacterium]|jgi:methylmalonyl-CoA/ethylmalonyl-CoA epimerase
MEIHHIGYAVSNIDLAIEQFRLLGYSVGDVIVDDYRHVYIAFARQGAYCIELIAPNGEHSPVSKILQKNGPTPYHICYVVDDMDASLALLKEQNWVLIVPPANAIAFDNRTVAFVYNRSVGIAELLAR